MAKLTSLSDPKLNDITGLILAGGRSARLGNKDKGLIAYKGRLLIEHQINLLTNHTRRILISANRNIESYLSYGFDVVTDNNDSFKGPLQGVLQGLKTCRTPWLYVLPIDLPELPPTILETAIDKYKKTPKHLNNAISYFTSDEREHYLCMLIHRSELNYLSEFINKGGRRVKSFHDSRSSTSLAIGISEKYFKNLNEVQDIH